jgi:hypothetical protein
MGIVVLAINPRNIISEVNDNKREADALTIYQALEQYVIKNNTYPDSIKNMPNNSSAYICKTTATSCNSNTNTQINLSSILVPTYMSKIPEYSTDTNNSGFYVVRDSNGKIGIGGVKQINNITFVKGLESQSFATIPIPPIVSNGLVLHLDAGNASSYPGTGTTWFDLSGNNNNGTLVNGVRFDNGNGGSLSFDGVDDYVSFAYNPSLTTQVTVEIWMILRSTSPNGTAWIAGRELSYRILYSSNGFVWVCATQNNPWYTAGTAISAGSINPYTQIYQVVGTYNGANNGLYVNGALKTTGTTISGDILTAGNYDLIRSGAGNVAYGKGDIYLHRIYNRALTPQEIQQNFNATRGRFGL